MILKTFYTAAVERILSLNITSWFGNCSLQDRKALQRVIRAAECCTRSVLPSLMDIFIKHCRSRAIKIIKHCSHPANCLFHLLNSGRQFCRLKSRSMILRKSFLPQATSLLNQDCLLAPPTVILIGSVFLHITVTDSTLPIAHGHEYVIWLFIFLYTSNV